MEYTLEFYNLNITNDRFDKVAETITQNRLSYFDKLSGVGSASFAFNIDDPITKLETILPYKTNVLIKREGFPVWLGCIVDITISDSPSGGEISFQVIDYLYHLAFRFSEQNFFRFNTNANTVVTDLLSYTQNLTNGTLRIQNGSIETIDPINETLQYGNIFEAILNLHDNITSFDFYSRPIVDANNKLDYVEFNLVKSKGRYRDDLRPLTYSMINNLSAKTQTDIVNSVVVLGNGTGDSIPTVITENADLQLGYTRREAVVKESSVKNLDTLTEKANAYIQNNGVLRYDLNVTLNPESGYQYGDYVVGDTIDINIKKENNSFIDFTGTARIIENRVDVDMEGVEFLTPKLQYT